MRAVRGEGESDWNILFPGLVGVTMACLFCEYALSCLLGFLYFYICILHLQNYFIFKKAIRKLVS